MERLDLSSHGENGWWMIALGSELMRKKDIELGVAWASPQVVMRNSRTTVFIIIAFRAIAGQVLLLNVIGHYTQQGRSGVSSQVFADHHTQTR